MAARKESLFLGLFHFLNGVRISLEQKLVPDSELFSFSTHWSQGTVNNIQLNTLTTTKVKLDKNVLCVDISCVSMIGKGDQGILTKRTWNTSHAPLYLIGNSLSKQILQKLNVYQNTRMV